MRTMAPILNSLMRMGIDLGLCPFGSLQGQPSPQCLYEACEASAEK